MSPHKPLAPDHEPCRTLGPCWSCNYCKAAKVWRCRWCGRRVSGVWGWFHKPDKCERRGR